MAQPEMVGKCMNSGDTGQITTKGFVDPIQTRLGVDHSEIL